MIKLDHTVTASPEQMEFVIEGMRNPHNSWSKSDSEFECDAYFIGDIDLELMNKLSKAGRDHRKYMRQIPVYVRITAPLYWWKEFDTYKVGTVANSCSTMHKITEKEFTVDDFSHDQLFDTTFLEKTIEELNRWRDQYLKYKDKSYWWQLIQLLPSSYNQTRNVMLNYEVLANIYKSRKEHKLDEWRIFCRWIRTLPHSEIITGKGD